MKFSGDNSGTRGILLSINDLCAPGQQTNDPWLSAQLKIKLPVFRK